MYVHTNMRSRGRTYDQNQIFVITLWANKIIYLLLGRGRWGVRESLTGRGWKQETKAQKWKNLTGGID